MIRPFINNYIVNIYSSLRQYLSRVTHQIFAFAGDWSERVTCLIVPKLNPENIRVRFPIFKTAPLSSKLTVVFEICSRKTVYILEHGLLSEHIYAQTEAIAVVHLMYNFLLLCVPGN